MFLYLIQCESFYKIGIATSVYARLKDISVCNPFPVALHSQYKFKDAESVEKKLHQRFRDKKVKGEWFRLESCDVETIENRYSKYRQRNICKFCGNEKAVETSKKCLNCYRYKHKLDLDTSQLLTAQ